MKGNKGANIAYPDKYHKVTEFFDREYGDLETCTKLNDCQKLLFYALRQQVEHGPCTSGAPFIWQVRERAKHDAWKQLGAMTKFEAMVHFVTHLEECIGGNVDWGEKLRDLNGMRDQQRVGVENGTGESNANEQTERGVSEAHWDADVQAHLQPSAENIEYLAREVMRLRGELQQVRPNRVVPTPIVVPPRKPIDYVSTKNIVPPARTLATVATRTALLNAQTTNNLVERQPQGWSEWLGLI
ncbi:hypothetical protein, conserved [Trypanosoma brucei gambiense DAL972]|uniref:ACB domain-containing protein n=1 Tax=Trypanosoma brucei gambiense (strain MHOM/CI/86/DAL972) TaxID=679716 RepID=D0A6I0_TRYB9|nr:hypothetical protein, conserved [Trypanosoma brucei gambiense DAL972]CBH17281.1 hypothetical protein, conserved [Trypanosoma brucei gambiense DAL972]|eukprot:XP_011779545.1 hypothetical protein, conserved [Trypanosoma brucei gambiense DAL972]